MSEIARLKLQQRTTALSQQLKEWWIMDVELAKRAYFTPAQYVERARQQAASGHISSDMLKLAAVVMETPQGDGLITLSPTNDSGRGRGLSYL